MSIMTAAIVTQEGEGSKPWVCILCVQESWQKNPVTEK